LKKCRSGAKKQAGREAAGITPGMMRHEGMGRRNENSPDKRFLLKIMGARFQVRNPSPGRGGEADRPERGHGLYCRKKKSE